MRVYFARHGESEANVLGVISNRDLPHHLTEVGRRQALALARSLADEVVAAVYASPIPRAVETAEAVAGVLGVRVEVVDALRESDCGAIEGRGDAEAWAAHDRVLADWLDRGDSASRIEGGESLDDVRARFAPFVDGLIAQYGGTDDRLLVIAHGSLFRVMLPVVLAGLDPVAWPDGSLPPTGVVVADEVAGRLVWRERPGGARGPLW